MRTKFILNENMEEELLETLVWENKKKKPFNLLLAARNPKHLVMSVIQAAKTVTKVSKAILSFVSLKNPLKPKLPTLFIGKTSAVARLVTGKLFRQKPGLKVTQKQNHFNFRVPIGRKYRQHSRLNGSRR